MSKKPEQLENENDSEKQTQPGKPTPDAVDESTGEAGDGMPTDGQAKISAIGNTLVEDMPEVQQHAIDQEAEQQAEKIAEHTGPDAPKDKNGATFDPAIHKVDKQGNPTLTKLGNLILKPGRKAGKSTTGASVVNTPGSAPTDPAIQKRAESRAAGVASANLILMLGVGIGGDEWQPRVDEKQGLNEKTMLEGAFGDYFEATGKTDIPPGMALTVAIGAYALPRFTMPKTQSRVGIFKKWITKKIANRRLKKEGLEVVDIKENKPAELKA